MKVCLLSRFFDLRNGGIGRYSQELLRELINRGVNVTTVSQDSGLPLGQGRVKYFIYTAFEIGFKIPSGQDVYHACAPTEALHSPKPLTVFFHDLIPLYKTRTWYKGIAAGYFKHVCEVAVKKADAIMVQSEQTKREIVANFNVDESSVTVIRHGISPSLKPQEKKDDIFRIGTLSYLDPRKRIDVLIKAFLEANVEGELVIAGKGPEYPKLRELSKKDHRIKFVGFVPDDRLAEFYNSLDVFIFPSKIEGYGLPLIEAMACKKTLCHS